MRCIERSEFYIHKVFYIYIKSRIKQLQWFYKKSRTRGLWFRNRTSSVEGK